MITPERYQKTWQIKIETTTYSPVSQKARLIPDIFFPCRISVQDFISDMGILVPKKISKRVVKRAGMDGAPLFNKRFLSASNLKSSLPKSNYDEKRGYMAS
ncbi:hypothetical protein CDAR_14081 [Caerostris darwini]|uniref:Uncharacterized protein n=1 Tax=Caerostris darwini TaxID=1538125 RepID=A0AAV4N743_9ARAC|nr:hypothetical protein CDAR_14081 [Caerostris darwini]